MPFNPGLTIDASTEETLQSIAGMNIPPYDYIGVTTQTTNDIYEFYINGALGDLVATINVQYTDSGKNTLLSVTKT